MPVYRITAGEGSTRLGCGIGNLSTMLPHRRQPCLPAHGSCQRLACLLAASALLASLTAAQVPAAELVASPETLLHAVQRGVRHIVITNHLDLRELPHQASTSGWDFCLLTASSTQSIRVCTQPECCILMTMHLSPRQQSTQTRHVHQLLRNKSCSAV